MRLNKREILTVAIGVVLLMIAVFLQLALYESMVDPEGEGEAMQTFGGIAGVFAFNILGILFGGFGSALKSKRNEISVRLGTHSVLCYVMSFTAVLLDNLTALPNAALAGVCFGAYVLIYYVFGVVQIPLNIRRVKAGYSHIYVLFYPLLSKRRREILLLGGKAIHKNHKFSFESEGRKGEIVGEFFYVRHNAYGSVFLYNRYLVSTFLSTEWNGKTFDRFADAIWGCDFRAVGYCVEENQVRVVCIPSYEEYENGIKRLNSFFAKNKIQARNYLYEYANFQTDVMTELLPYPVYYDFRQIHPSLPFDREKVDWENRALLFFAEEVLKRDAFVCIVYYVVPFPPNASVESMKKFAEDASKIGFLRQGMYSVEGGVFEQQSKDYEIKWNARNNVVFLLKFVNCNPLLSSAEMRLPWALSIYRSLYSCTSGEYEKRRGKIEAKGKDEEEILLDEKTIDTVLRDIRPQADDDLMFGADVYSLNDFKEAGLVWLVDKGRWMIRNDAPKLLRMFELLQKLEKKKPEKADSTELTESLRELHAAAGEAGALAIEWWISRGDKE